MPVKKNCSFAEGGLEFKKRGGGLEFLAINDFFPMHATSPLLVTKLKLSKQTQFWLIVLVNTSREFFRKDNVKISKFSFKFARK